jgi:hypothetical protein
MSVEIDLLATIHAPKVLPQYYESFMANRTKLDQSDCVSPMRDIVARPTDHVDMQERRSPGHFLFFVLPHLVPVQSLGRAADGALAAVLFDDLLSELPPYVYAQTFGVGPEIAPPQGPGTMSTRSFNLPVIVSSLFVGQSRAGPRIANNHIAFKREVVAIIPSCSVGGIRHGSVQRSCAGGG